MKTALFLGLVAILANAIVSQDGFANPDLQRLCDQITFVAGVLWLMIAVVAIHLGEKFSAIRERRNP